MNNLFSTLVFLLLCCTDALAENSTNLAVPNASASANPTLVPTARTDDFGVKLFQRHLDRIKQGPIDLLFLGDSITGCFFEQGMKDWNARYSGLNAAAFGVAGDGVQNVLWRIENGELKNISPKLIVLLIGTNNLGTPPSQIAEGIKNLVGEIEKRCPTSHILLLGLLPRGKAADSGYRSPIIETNKIIANLQDKKQVTYLDFGANFLLPNGDMIEGITFDYTHPNSAGCHIWYEAIQPVIDSYFPSPVAKK